MTSEIITLDKKPVADYTAAEVAECKRFLNCERATEAEWKKLVLLATKYNLNPLLSEIWIISGVGVMIGLNGMVKIAERSGQYDGMQTETKFDEKGHPFSHTCTVWRKDMAHPIIKTVYHSEFARPNIPIWKQKPVYMGEKVAEVHALKRAFSLMDLNIPEEFGYADTGAEPYEATVNGEPVRVEPMQKQPVKEEFCTCGNKSMEQPERERIQAAFAERGFELPAGICRKCADKLYREKLNLGGDATK